MSSPVQPFSKKSFNLITLLAMTFFPKSNMAGFTEGLPQGINKGGCPLLTIKKFGNIFPSKNRTSTFRGKNVIDNSRYGNGVLAMFTS